MMRTVYLEGELGSKFGTQFSIFAKRPTDVIKCLDCNFPDFRRYLLESESKNVGFTLQCADSYLDETELLMTQEEGDIIFSAVPIGSDGDSLKSIVKIIVGAVIMYYTMGTAFGPATGTMATLAKIGATVGFSAGLQLTMTGIAELLAPDPSVDNRNTPQEDKSYLFQGSEHNIEEGFPIPVLYGELRIPGQPISFATVSPQQIHNLPTDIITFVDIDGSQTETKVY